jgi:hypothetical protein
MEPWRRNFVFAIPIAPRRDDAQWANLEELLAATLRSILNQSEPGFRVFIAGHERPALLDAMTDPRISFLAVTHPRPTTDKDRRLDKFRKRWAIAVEVRKLGGSYFMYLDADDYVHRDLVGHVLSDDNGAGYFIPEGMVLDHRNRTIAPVPGVWDLPFNEVCGSSGIVCFAPGDLPKRPYPEQFFRFGLFFRVRNHHFFQDGVVRGKSMTPVPFGAAVYSINNGLNLSNVLVRTAKRQEQLIGMIRKRQVPLTPEIAACFGI